MRQIYTSLDIGSDSIKIVVCELYQNKLNLLACSSYKAKGIKKGLITDVKSATESIRNAIDSVQNMIGVTINKVIATIPSYFAEFTVKKAEINIMAQSVTHSDVRNILDSITLDNLSDDKEIVSILPVDFKVDDVTGIKNPLEIEGKVLGVRTIVVTTEKKYIYSVVGLLENMGLEVIDTSITGIGDYATHKTKSTENGICSIINIGSDITNVALYNKGIILKNSVISMGGKNINKDIAYMYKTDNDTAEDLKKTFALGHKRKASTTDMIKIKTDYDDDLKINQYEISEIVSSRLEEILNLAKKELNILTSRKIDYIIITGGTSNMADIEYIISDVFGSNANIGNIKLIGIRDNKYSSCIGNIINFIDKLKLRGEEYTMISNSAALRLSSVGNEYQGLNNVKMLEKMTEYFLANRRI